MVDDPKWELAILSTAHSFYRKLLEDFLGEELLVPKGLEAEAISQPDIDLHDTLERMRRWLRLLDLAVTTAALRHGLAADGDPEVAEALLRYYARKPSPSDADRDKTDFAATFLYRNPRVAGQWETRGMAIDGVTPMSPFEIALMEILADNEPPDLSEETALLLYELDSLRDQAEVLNDFDEIMELAIVQRGRRLKQLLGDHFYHPAVLNSITTYNVTLGRRFQTLFRDAAREIKGFARSMQNDGGNPQRKLDGDVTVSDVAGMEEDEVLGTEYNIAQERFSRMLRVKKALESHKPGAANDHAPRPNHATTPSCIPAPSSAPSITVPAFARTGASAAAAPALRPVALAYDGRQEEPRMQSVADSIRAFVLAAGSGVREVVPMRSFNLVLTTAETDAFCADFIGEDSLRGQTVRMLVRIVAILTRMGTEYNELKQRQKAPTLAKPHADALRYLLQLANASAEEADSLFFELEQKGLTVFAAAMLQSLDRLRGRAEFILDILQRWERREGAQAN
jgi:hypothetical protein